MLASDGRFVERRACDSAGLEDRLKVLRPRAKADGDEKSSDAGEKTEPRTRLRPAAIGDVDSAIVSSFGALQ